MSYQKCEDLCGVTEIKRQGQILGIRKISLASLQRIEAAQTETWRPNKYQFWK